jgi:hypothetical protein
LNLFNINGSLKSAASTASVLTQMLITKDGKHLVTGDEAGVVCVRKVQDLSMVHQGEGAGSAVRSMTFVLDDGKEKYVLAGLQDGRLVIFLFNSLISQGNFTTK